MGAGVTEDGYKAPKLKRMKRKGIEGLNFQGRPSNLGSVSNQNNSTQSSRIKKQASSPPTRQSTCSSGSGSGSSSCGVPSPPATLQFSDSLIQIQPEQSTSEYAQHYIDAHQFQYASQTGLPLCRTAEFSSQIPNIEPSCNSQPANSLIQTPILDDVLQQPQHSYLASHPGHIYTPQVPVHFQIPQQTIIASLYSQIPDPALTPLLDHYLQHTCISLDPFSNGAYHIQAYLPFAARSLSAVYSILATSALHLREYTRSDICSDGGTQGQKYTELAIKYKTQAFHQLSSEIQVAGVNATAHLPILAAILGQLTLNIFEVQSTEYAMHLSACRSSVSSLLFAGMGLENPAWYLAARLAKYDTFAVLLDGHRPIIPLSACQDHRLISCLDAVWCVPSKWAILSAWISSWAYNSDPKATPTQSSDLLFIEQQLSSPIITVNPRIPDILTNIWQLATRIHFYRVILHPTVRADQNPGILAAYDQSLFLLQEYINLSQPTQPSHSHSGSDYICASLAWPLFVLVTVSPKRNKKAQTLEETVATMWRRSRVPTFNLILGMTKDILNLDPALNAQQYNENIQQHLTSLLA